MLLLSSFLVRRFVIEIFIRRWLCTSRRSHFLTLLLQPGAYRVTTHAVSKDGHYIKVEVYCSIRPDPGTDKSTRDYLNFIQKAVKAKEKDAASLEINKLVQATIQNAFALYANRMIVDSIYQDLEALQPD